MKDLRIELMVGWILGLTLRVDNFEIIPVLGSELGSVGFLFG